MMKRPMVIAINALLVLVIVGLITATWMPVIYTSGWFQSNRWVRNHLLNNSSEEKLPQMKTDEHR